MRSARWLPLFVFLQACASQTSASERQLRQHEERIKQLTANADRLEERMLALEAALRAGSDTVRPVEEAKSARPELPVVKVLPDGQKPATSAEAPLDSDAVEDSHRLTIVGEGSRVEARAANETTTPARRSTPANSRQSKGNQASSSSASTGGVSQ